VAAAVRLPARGQISPQQLLLARRAKGGALPAPLSAGLSRGFCAEASASSEKPRLKKVAKRGGLDPAKVASLGVVGLGVAYAASSDDALHNAVEMFEDFNDSSREFFEGIGDRLLGRKQEPWLLDFATMKYPEHLPTLVLDLDKVILHLEHDSIKGWHVIKRPFADKFFKELSAYYEIVLFSDDVFPVALDISIKWELPITGVLHRDFCKKKRNHYVKDLSKLGRDLSHVIIIDNSPVCYSLQPENAIPIRTWRSNASDRELLDLIPILCALSTVGNIPDIIRQELLSVEDDECGSTLTTGTGTRGPIRC